MIRPVVPVRPLMNMSTKEALMHVPSILILGIALFLQGCSYAISPEVSRTADRTVTFEKLQADPSLHKGKTVILGGEIVQIRTLKNGTLIEVSQKELDYWGKPRRTSRTGGHFLVLHARMLDAMVYAAGRELTIAGEVTGEDERSLGESALTYPLLRAREIKLWPGERPGWDKPQWLDRLYDPSAPQSKY